MQSGIRSVDPEEKQPKLSTVTLSSRNDMIFIYQRSVQTNESKIALQVTGSWMVSSCSWRPLHRKIRYNRSGPREAQNGTNFDFKCKFDIEGQGHSFPKKHMDLNSGVLYLWSKSDDLGLNHMLSCGQAQGWRTDQRTDGHTHTHTDARRQR